VILSRKHQFIFIKTNKTAGAPIELALSRHCGDDDTITPLLPDDCPSSKHLGRLSLFSN